MLLAKLNSGKMRNEKIVYFIDDVYPQINRYAYPNKSIFMEIIT